MKLNEEDFETLMMALDLYERMANTHDAFRRIKEAREALQAIGTY